MFCKYCGKEIKDNAKFCVYCGKEVKSGGGAGRDSGRQEKAPGGKNGKGGSETVKRSAGTGEESGKSGIVETGRGPEKAGRAEKTGEPEESRSNAIWYIIPILLILAVAAAVLYFVMIKPRTGSGRQDDEISSDREGEETKTGETGEKIGEENSGTSEEEPAVEETKMTTEQIRVSLENTLSDLEAQYGYADLSPRSETLDFEGDYSSQLDRWNMWTNLYGIVKAEICDLDGDGQEELAVIWLEEKNIHLCIYEADEDQPSSVPVKSAELIEERSGDIHRYEDVLKKVDGNGASYLLFMQAYWGGWGDGYYGQVKLYRYDGTYLYTPLTVQQEGEASSEFVYFAREYETNGAMLSEEVIYDDAALYGTYMDENDCRGRMKELFGAYGISIGDRAAVYIYDGSFDEFLAPGQSSEELMKLRMWSDVPGNDWESLIFYFNDAGRPSAGADEYILPDSDSRYLSLSDLAGMTKEECRFARNELYARHGRIFDDAELQDYFDAKDWYMGTVSSEDFDEGILNDYEMKNRDLIVEYEEEMGYR